MYGPVGVVGVTSISGVDVPGTGIGVDVAGVGVGADVGVLLVQADTSIMTSIEIRDAASQSIFFFFTSNLLLNFISQAPGLKD